ITRPTSPAPSPPASATPSRTSRGGRSEARPPRRSIPLRTSSAPAHRNFTIFPGDTPPFPWYNVSHQHQHPKSCTQLFEEYDEDNAHARDVPRIFAPHALAMGDSGSDGRGLRGILPVPFEPLGLHPADPG